MDSFGRRRQAEMENPMASRLEARANLVKIRQVAETHRQKNDATMAGSPSGPSNSYRSPGRRILVVAETPRRKGNERWKPAKAIPNVLRVADRASAEAPAQDIDYRRLANP